MKTSRSSCTSLLGWVLLAGCGDASGTGGGELTGGGDATSVTTATSTGASPISTSTGTTGAGAGGEGGGGACLGSTAPCDGEGQCCDGFQCDMTTLGQVCCGGVGAGCATLNGEDCCGALLCVGGTCIESGTIPDFRAPFPCGETWTYSHHDQEVRRALDFVDTAGGTNGAPALAAAWGLATQHDEPGGAGNYIVIDHGGGWTTYYFHLQSFSVADGTFVERGQEVGLVGSTGASSGPHLHFEELRNGEGQDIWLDGQLLTPYPGSYFQAELTSANCPDP
jgi:hypothetical protein